MERKLTYQLIVASALVIAGLTLLFLGFFTIPMGEIHNSVLIAFGEVCTFAGALMGVDYHYRYRDYERRKIRKDEDESSNLDR